MTIRVIKQGAKKTVHDLVLTVETAGTTIRVKAGGFRMAGEDFVLSEDESAVLQADAACVTSVVGYVVRKLDDNQPHILVDEVLGDGEDYPFNFNGSPYKLLHRLFRLLLPAGASTLDDLDVEVFHFVEKERKGREVANG